MQLSYCISLQESKFNYIAKDSWRRKVMILAGLGYKAVELSIRDPEAVKINNLESALKRHQLKLNAIGTGQIFVDDGLSLSSPRNALRIKAVNCVKNHIDIARIFNTQVIIGLARGKSDNQKDQDKQCRRNLIDSFRRLCDYANKNRVIIAVEPINRYEASFLNQAEEAIDFIRIFRCKFIKLMLDTFHMNIEEKNFIDPIIKAKEHLSHFHLADSNRLCPGEGHIDFSRIINALKKIGYTGYLSAEILPLPNFKLSARRYFRNITRLL